MGSNLVSFEDELIGVPTSMWNVSTQQIQACMLVIMFPSKTQMFTHPMEL